MAGDGLKNHEKATEPKGRKGSLPLPGDGLAVDVDGALALLGVRKIRCGEAAR